jgi:hypothetical protein
MLRLIQLPGIAFRDSAGTGTGTPLPIPLSTNCTTADGPPIGMAPYRRVFLFCDSK